MLYPKEDQDAHKLQYTCRTCQYTEEAESSCIFRNELNTSAGETAGVTQDVASDPTVGSFCSAFNTPFPVTQAAENKYKEDNGEINQPMLCMTCDTIICCAGCGVPSPRLLLKERHLHSPDRAAKSSASSPDTRRAQFQLQVNYMLPEDPFADYDEELMDDDGGSNMSTTDSTDSTMTFGEPVDMEALINPHPETPAKYCGFSSRAEDGAMIFRL